MAFSILKKQKTKADFVNEHYDEKNVNLVKNVIQDSDEVITDIYHMINKTVDNPSKNEISIYRKSLLKLLNSKNDEKFRYIYEIAAKAVFDYKEKEEKRITRLQNEVLVSPNIFTITWAEINANIKNSLENLSEIDPESIKYAFIEEHRRLLDLKNKINKMIALGIDVPNAKKALEVNEKTFLKLTDLINIFMLENFNDVSSMVQEIEVFEKQYNIDEKTPNSVFIDANYKKITNLADPKILSDAATKNYVDQQIQFLLKRIESKKNK
ncbi:hypothetical protein NV226_01750 [Mycoplasma iguanae]|uniref:Uncharacterized protein n=1 Tax=Mycoplasma iguanae TaxID=292461 RepID=A0ABY5R904_9MOLU|nr:hypothetical protein [Mycoplasma iguanae]UVD81440.1 hypothetical protein NV226_01750 [Mycoplasma iguanae]